MPSFDSRVQSFRSPTQIGGLTTDIGLQHFSAKHSGLYLYVGRILRPIWNVRCIKQETIGNKSVVSDIREKLLQFFKKYVLDCLFFETSCMLLLLLFLKL